MTQTAPRRSMLTRFLDGVERTGNALPDPVTLFALMIVMVIIASVIAAAAGVAVPHPGTGDVVEAKSLLAADQIQRLLVEMPKTFTSFAPLGYVLLVMLGVGVAEKTGFLTVALRSLVSGVSPRLITAALVFAGIMSSLAADAGYVVLIPLGAAIFMGAGRHPVAGLAAGFAGVAGGFSSNLILTPLDPLLAGITQEAARLVAADYVVEVTANYYLMLGLVPLFVIVGTWVTDRIVEPRLPKWVPTETPIPAVDGDVSAVERRGIQAALLSVVVLAAGVAALAWAPGFPLRGEDGSFLPLMRSLVSLMFIAFLVAGIAYGVTTRVIASDKDVVRMMADAMSDLGVYIVLAFIAAHFIAMFSWSNLGIISAVVGADTLRSIGFEGSPLLVSLILLAATINILVGSASAKWAFLAPIFVPMLMLLGLSPEATQAAYRIGDSSTNMITPLLPYFPLILIVGKRYDPNFGIGTLVATMLPFAIAFGVASTAFFVGWLALGLPLGPGISSTF
ncbi:Aminobenzoyl-glutamate transport protein [Candidatus Phaeomarinobacter ectocarpi]|uniref:Aminobenzoyl-glutamate transport protein n=1 Tax=Candidatus Phaeomarinibacter ectocarpi TaxID=1458461 RepID=X5MEW5_9HYPH|nr:AbgT family transporter [Candidatus Phaeomarinobacter ectocarpi]CDO61177.1 Aminobenzoyl-glutamate transport protein [Candidatus Phaeomarinobacter ectocarpi]